MNYAILNETVSLFLPPLVSLSHIKRRVSSLVIYALMKDSTSRLRT